MNQAQRKFLMDRIQDEIKRKVKALEDSKPERPDAQNHVLLALMSGTLKLKSSESILAGLKQRAMNSTGRSNWLNYDAWSTGNGRVTFELEDIIELPDEYIRLRDEYLAECQRINEEKAALTGGMNMLMTRIQIASNSTLEAMVREVDDMGDISLMDCTLKRVSAGTYDAKLLNE